MKWRDETALSRNDALGGDIGDGVIVPKKGAKHGREQREALELHGRPEVLDRAAECCTGNGLADRVPQTPTRANEHVHSMETGQ